MNRRYPNISFLFILVLLSVPFQPVFAQFYSLYADSAEGHYKYYAPNSDCSNDSCIVSFSRDSVRITSNAKTVFLRPVIGPNDSLPDTCQYDTRDTSWLGRKVHLLNILKNQFFNWKGDTIEFTHFTAPGDSFKVMTLDNGGIIEAHVDSQNNGYLYKNRYFNVRFLRFQAEGPNGKDTAHVINGKEIIYSYHFGMLKGLNMYRFPRDTTSYYLNGITNINPDSGDVRWQHNDPHKIDFLNYLTGQEWHYEIWDSNETDTTYHILRKKMVIDKKIWESVDSIRYKFFIVDVSFATTPFGKRDTLVSTDTIKHTYDLSRYKFLSKRSNEFFKTSPYGPGFMKVQFDGEIGGQSHNRIRKTAHASFNYDTTSHCLVKDSLHFGRAEFIDGVGLGMLENEREGNSYKKELVYYQRGIETNGKPFNFEQYFTTSSVVRPKPQLNVYPNPVYSDLKIRRNNGGNHQKLLILLYDNRGRKMWSKNIKHSQKNITIPMEKYADGIYLLRIHGIGDKLDNTIYNKKIIKH